MRSKIIFLISLLLIFALPGQALDFSDFPKLKAGGWEMIAKNHSLPAGMPANLSTMKMYYCIDEATQEKLIAQSQQQQQTDCEKPVIEKSANKYVADFKCNFSGYQTTVHSETTFSGDTEMVNDMTSTTQGMPPMKMTTTARYQGECKAGMKPGDMSMVNPMTGKDVSLSDMEALRQMGKDLTK